VPFREQHVRMREGERHVVAVCLDERSNRVVGTSRLGRHFDYEPDGVTPGQRVSVLVYGLNDLGAHVVVDGRWAGMVYASETFRALAVGDAVTGWVTHVRPDGKLDVALQRAGRAATEDAQQVILTHLRAAGGRLPLHDKSPPDEIARVLGISKHAFKKAVGGLYKARKIALAPGGIVLVDGAEARP
jgi:predicted RNA-binding protein (virulence factor B family)